MTNQLTIITDYRDHFYSSVKKTDIGMNLPELSRYFSDLGWQVETMSYRDVDLSENWVGRIVLYQSSEDRGLFYKDYIEDVVLGLHCAGAILVPHFNAFRSHHNKAFQELYRRIVLPNSAIHSLVFGCREDLARAIDRINFPCVLKASAGAKGNDIYLCKSRSELVKAANMVSRTFNVTEWFKDKVKRRVRDYYVPVSQHKRKFIVQRFLPGLSGDYKVLVYGQRCVALERGIKPGDFRASGSGRLTTNAPVPIEVIEYAFELNRLFDVPCGSYDLALFDGKPELIEFQFMTFGTRTLFLSDRSFELVDGAVLEKAGKLNLEHAFVSAIASYLRDDH